MDNKLEDPLGSKNRLVQTAEKGHAQKSTKLNVVPIYIISNLDHGNRDSSPLQIDNIKLVNHRR